MIDPRLFENPITVFVPYNEILRDHNTFLLHLIMDNPNLRKQFEPYISFERFECQTDMRIRVLIMNRTKKNILEWLAIKKFDYEKNYRKLYEKFPQMFEESPPLDMYVALTNMVREDFVKRVIIYGEKRDIRTMYDLSHTFNKNEKIQYVTGPYLDVISAIREIDLFIDNDIDRLSAVMYMPEYYGSTFMIAQYGYNYELPAGETTPQLKGRIVNHAIRKKINLVEFIPFKLKYEHTVNG